MTDDENRNQYFLARATKRLNRDFRLITNDPIPAIDVALNEDDILDWHFVIHGKEDTPYQDGVYHGRLVFPPTFPFGPPKILFLTPNGRFKVNERICFSLSDFHPEEWKPAYSVSAVLRAVYDFMHETTNTIGSIDATDSERRRLARESMEYNRNNPSFCTFFEQLCFEETQNRNTSQIDSNVDVTASCPLSPADYVAISMETDPQFVNISDRNLPIDTNNMLVFEPINIVAPVENINPLDSNTCPAMENTPPVSSPIPPEIEFPTPMEISPSLVGENLPEGPNVTPVSVPMETAPPFVRNLPPDSDAIPASQSLETAPTASPIPPELEFPTPMETNAIHGSVPIEVAPLLVRNLPPDTDIKPASTHMESIPPVGSTSSLDTNNIFPPIQTCPSSTVVNFDQDTNATPVSLSMETTYVYRTFPQNTNMTLAGSKTVPLVERTSPLDIRDNVSIDIDSSNQGSNNSEEADSRTPIAVRGIIAPTGLIGNILPGEKYYSSYSFFTRSDNEFTNQPMNYTIAPYSSLGYSLIHKTPTCVVVSNVDNSHVQVIPKTSKKILLKDDSSYPNRILPIHKAGQKDTNKLAEEGNVFGKRPYSRPGITIKQIGCYSFSFFILTLAYAALLIYLLASLIISK